MRVIESLSWLWIAVGFVGAVGVIVGVWGEGWGEDRVMPYHKQRRLIKRFWEILLTGLALELIGLIGSTATSLALESRVEKLRKLNNELQEEVVKLEASVQWRRISDSKQKEFVRLLKDAPKGAVFVSTYKNAELESKIFAKRVRDMVETAGYTTKPNTLELEHLLRIHEELLLEIHDTNNIPACLGPLAKALRAIDIPVLVFPLEKNLVFDEPIKAGSKAGVRAVSADILGKENPVEIIIGIRPM